MSKNKEAEEKNINQEEVDRLNTDLALEKIQALEKRVASLESRVEKVDHFTAIQGQNMNVSSRNRRGRTGI